jgi:2-dehydro-3-deoxyphosphogluconate aldolase/(4S)-4-hydroxy-2-oxoglutarate aldolase
VKLLDMLRLAPVVPMVVIRDVEHAVPLALALSRGGLRMMEVSLQSPVAMECIARMAGEVPDAIVGAGGVLTGKDLKRATRAGARFAVSPGFSARLSDDAGIPWLPGVATASEVMKALEHGHDVVRLFPAALAGGLDMLRAFHAALPGAGFCPAYGIDFDNAASYLNEPNVVCVGGEWVTPDKAVNEGNWEHVEFLAHEAAGLNPSGG